MVLSIREDSRNGLEAVRMMLPPLRGFPRASFVCFMAADACLTARKQLARQFVPIHNITETKYIRQGIDSHGIGKRLPRGMFQVTKSRDASLSKEHAKLHVIRR